MLYVGTSGFGYHEWSPSFYPAGLAHAEFLRFYAGRFDGCELNATFFEMPRPRDLERYVEAVPDSFRFTLKLHRELTHEIGPALARARRFAEASRPLVEAGALGAVLAQFPFHFVNQPDNRAYLCRLRAALELPLVVELRNGSWMASETLGFLRGWGIGIACIDAPRKAGLPRPTALATSGLGYARFHGRNAPFWWRRDDVRRYDYRYRRRELLSWVPRLREIEKRTQHVFVVFNNHRHGYAVQNALALASLLRESAERTKGRTSARSRNAALAG